MGMEGILPVVSVLTTGSCHNIYSRSSRFPALPVLREKLSISVADIQGRDKDDNSSVRLDHLLTTEAHASPTLFT